MANCSKYVNQLSEYLDGTLGAFKATRVREHLKRCADCRNEYEDLAEVRAALQSVASPRARPGFWQHMEHRLAALPERRPARFARVGTLVPATVGGVALALAAALVVRLQYPVDRNDREYASPITIASASVGDSISVDSLVWLHARQSARHPLADTGRLRYIGSVSEQADIVPDGKLDIR